MPKVNRETFQNSNIPNPVVKGKGKVEKIDFGENTEEVKRIWAGLPPLSLVEKWKEAGIKGSYIPGTKLARMNRIKVLIGYTSNAAGLCSKCGINLNEYLVKYKTEGITIIERYCSEHVPDKI